MAVTWTQTDLDNLKEAASSGARRVRIGEREVEYRSLDEIFRMIKLVTAYLDSESTSTTTKVIKATYSKGEA